mgnify:CR=1 FL=1
MNALLPRVSLRLPCAMRCCPFRASLMNALLPRVSLRLPWAMRFCPFRASLTNVLLPRVSFRLPWAMCCCPFKVLALSAAPQQFKPVWLHSVCTIIQGVHYRCTLNNVVCIYPKIWKTKHLLIYTVCANQPWPFSPRWCLLLCGHKSRRSEVSTTDRCPHPQDGSGKAPTQ